jgi:hypothetical protein
MDDNARLQLQKMIKANDVEDMTELIRDLKHSVLLRDDINKLILLMTKYGNNSDDLYSFAVTECTFLFTYYTDIFNKIRKNEIDLKILFKFLDVLKEIENGDLDQHEGSFVVGKLLKEMYIDSALRKADKLNENNIPVIKVEPKNINWKSFKFLRPRG